MSVPSETKHCVFISFFRLYFLVILGILSLTFLILELYTSFSTTPFFTASLSLLKSTGTGTNLSTSNLSTLDFKLAKSTFLANFYVSKYFCCIIRQI